MKDIFIDSERSNSLRKNLLTQHISSVMTDEERASLWGLPDGCRMRENAKIISPEHLDCGSFVWIGEGAVLDASGGLEIGAHTSIGLNVMVWSHTSFLANLKGENEIQSPYIARSKTKIGARCFIGGPSVIYHGVDIGERSVILPMSVITKSIPPNSIVAGNPGAVIRSINDEYIDGQIKKFRESGQMK